MAERYADEDATDGELAEAATGALRAHSKEYGEIGTTPYWQSSEAAKHVCEKRFDNGDHTSVIHASSSSASAWATERVRSIQGLKHSEECRERLAEHANWLRDIFGSPFRPVTFSAEWRTGTVVSLAQQMYESRDFSAMPILADVLQDAGCGNADILTHCRDTNQVHVRGCWIVDLVLGKE